MYSNIFPVCKLQQCLSHLLYQKGPMLTKGLDVSHLNANKHCLMFKRDSNRCSLTAVEAHHALRVSDRGRWQGGRWGTSDGGGTQGGRWATEHQNIWVRVRGRSQVRTSETAVPRGECLVIIENLGDSDAGGGSSRTHDGRPSLERHQLTQRAKTKHIHTTNVMSHVHQRAILLAPFTRGVSADWELVTSRKGHPSSSKETAALTARPRAARSIDTRAAVAQAAAARREPETWGDTAASAGLALGN